MLAQDSEYAFVLLSIDAMGICGQSALGREKLFSCLQCEEEGEKFSFVAR